jgi:hypothetical protein
MPWLLVGALVVLGLLVLYWTLPFWTMLFRTLPFLGPRRTSVSGYDVWPDGTRHDWPDMTGKKEGK